MSGGRARSSVAAREGRGERLHDERRSCEVTLLRVVREGLQTSRPPDRAAGEIPEGEIAGVTLVCAATPIAGWIHE
jgi:hypothetical protein